VMADDYQAVVEILCDVKSSVQLGILCSGPWTDLVSDGAIDGSIANEGDLGT